MTPTSTRRSRASREVRARARPASARTGSTQDGVYDAFANKLAARVAQFKVGAGTEEGVTIGPLIEPAAIAVEATWPTRSRRAPRARRQASRARRTLLEPTILTDVTPQMRVAREETFGPGAPLFRFRTDDEAIAMANDTEFGLAAYFYSRDIGRIFRAAEGIESGMIGVNTGLISTAGRRSAASSNRASGAKGRSTGSTSTWK